MLKTLKKPEMLTGTTFDARYVDLAGLILNKLGIPSDRVVVVGGFAMACYGVRPPSDMDLLCADDVIRELMLEDETPSGLPVKTWRTPDGSTRKLISLAEDTGFDYSIDYLPSYSRRRLNKDYSILPSGFRIATPEALSKELLSRSGPKARQDLAEIQNLL
jgi:hypothetical protein